MGIGAILGIGGSLLQAGSASSAARSQERAAQQDLEFQKETRDLVFDRLDPWYQGGNLANQALMAEMGLGAAPMIGGTAPSIRTVVTPGTAAPTVSMSGVRPDDRGGFGQQTQVGMPDTTRYQVGG